MLSRLSLPLRLRRGVLVNFRWGGDAEGGPLAVEQVSEDGYGFAHVGAHLGVLAEAVVGEAGQFEEDLGGVLPVHPGVDDLEQLVAAEEEGPGPVHEVVLPPRPAVVQCYPADEQLQQHHPETVHVALRRQMACATVVNTTAL